MVKGRFDREKVSASHRGLLQHIIKFEKGKNMYSKFDRTVIDLTSASDLGGFVGVISPSFNRT